MLVSLRLLLFVHLLVGALCMVPRPASADSGLVIARVEVLPDRGYTWPRIRTDSTLVFRSADSLRPAQANQFWLRVRVRNASRYTAAGRLIVLPNLDNTLYYFDEDAQAWLTRRAGVEVATDSQQVKGPLPLRVPGRGIITVYVMVRLSRDALLPPATRLLVSWEPEAEARADSLFYTTAWAVAVAVLLLLLLTNLPTYLRYRDQTALYYVCTQVGAILYLTAYRNHFRALFPRPLFNQFLLPNGLGYGYTLNNVAMHLSVVLMLIGFMQLTRVYLNTRAHLPRHDTALHYALRGYCAFTVVVGLVNLSGFPLNYYSLRLDNLLVLAVVGILLSTAVSAYRQQLPLARIYLLANVLPMLCVGAVAIYHIGRGMDNTGRLLLPDLAILSYALCFSMALSVRLQMLQRTLLNKEREADHLALDIQRQELRHREIVLQNSHIQAALRQLEQQGQARDAQAQQLSATHQQLSEDHQQQQAANQQLQRQLETNRRELASTALYVEQKNALLAELKSQIRDLNKQRPDQQKDLAGIQSILNSHVYLDEDWGRFKLHFEQVHPRFFEELRTNYPALTPHEQRLASYFHIQLSAKEIAALLNIDPASVRRAKTRLYKKMTAADLAAGRATTGGPPAGE